MHSIRFTVFGSPSSLDKDIFVQVDKLPTLIKECKVIVDELEEQLQKDYKEKVNVNIGEVVDGNIVSVFKGTPDEVNNSLYYTSLYHDENIEHLVKSPVKRDIERKVHRTFRVMLSMLSRTTLRTLVKEALRSDINKKIDVMDIVALSEIKEQADLGKRNMDYPDYLKTMSFQIGQTFALLLGKELYTKEDIADYFPGLKPYLKREVDADLKLLQMAKTALIQESRKLDFKHLKEY